MQRFGWARRRPRLQGRAEVPGAEAQVSIGVGAALGGARRMRARSLFTVIAIMRFSSREE